MITARMTHDNGTGAAVSGEASQGDVTFNDRSGVRIHVQDNDIDGDGYIAAHITISMADLELLYRTAKALIA
jgi:hypothetical protein